MNPITVLLLKIQKKIINDYWYKELKRDLKRLCSEPLTSQF